MAFLIRVFFIFACLPHFVELESNDVKKESFLLQTTVIQEKVEESSGNWNWKGFMLEAWALEE